MRALKQAGTGLRLQLILVWSWSSRLEWDQQWGLRTQDGQSRSRNSSSACQPLACSCNTPHSAAPQLDRVLTCRTRERPEFLDLHLQQKCVESRLQHNASSNHRQRNNKELLTTVHEPASLTSALQPISTDLELPAATPSKHHHPTWTFDWRSPPRSLQLGMP